MPKSCTPQARGSCSKTLCKGKRGGLFYINKSGRKTYCSPSIRKGPKPTKIIHHNTEFLTTNTRVENIKTPRDLTRKILVNVSSRNVCTNSPKELWKKLEMGQLLGTGQWGAVYSAHIPNSNDIAIKFTKMDKDSMRRPYDETLDAWEEVFFLRDISKLVESGICPNLPILVNDFSCVQCNGMVPNTKKDDPCLVTIMEKADGNLEDVRLAQYLHTDLEWYSVLFQIMAGLHTIHNHIWLEHRDVKLDNVLYHRVTPGGYWRYRILGRDYDVPNVGWLMVLTDFNVSSSYDITKRYFREDDERDVGNRAIIWKRKSLSALKVRGYDSDTVRLKGTHKSGSVIYEEQSVFIDRNMDIVDDFSLTKRQKGYLRRKGYDYHDYNSFLKDPTIQTPMDFRNDVQDAIRMFTGGKRMTQNGTHHTMGAPSSVKKYLKGFITRKTEFTLNKSHAGYFIRAALGDKFKPSESHHILQTFSIS